MSRTTFLKSVLCLSGADQSLAGIVRSVSMETGVSVSDILAPGWGKRTITSARQEAYRRAVEADHRLCEIGRFFDRDNKTIYHGVKAATKRKQ